MAKIIKAAARNLLSLWAKSGKADGYLYYCVEKWGHQLASDKLISKKTSNGLVFNCDLRDHIQQQIYFFGAYEPIDCFLLCEYIEEGMTAVDAGANIGFYSLMMAKTVGPSGVVHSFEPISSNYEKLSIHCEINHLADRIKLNKCALWSETTELTFHLPKRHEFNIGSFTAGQSDEEAIAVQNCPAITLDSYLKNTGCKKLHILKMDIEGAEMEALKGAVQTLKNDKPLIFLEVCKDTCDRFGYAVNDLWLFLKEFGYSPWVFEGIEAHKISDFKDITQKNVFITADSEFAKKATSGYDEIMASFRRSAA